MKYSIGAYAADSLDAAFALIANFQGDVVEEIKTLIRGRAAVIADLSESKPNVLYETGFAHALRLPTIHTCSAALAQLPFDIRNWNTIEYAKGQTHTLRKVLTNGLACLLKNAPSGE